MPVREAQRQVLQPLSAGGGSRHQHQDPHQCPRIGQRRRQERVHGLCEHRDLLVLGVGQRKDGRADDQHGYRGGAHDDQQAAKGLFALRRWRAVVGGDQVCKNLDSGHHRQDAHKTAEGKVNVLGTEGLEIKTGQTESILHDGRQHHRPEQEQHPARRRAKGACSHLRAAIHQPADQETQGDGQPGTILDAQDGIVQSWEPVGDEGDHGGHTDQEGQGVLDEGDAAIHLHRPRSKLFLAQATAAAAVGDPDHNQPVHCRYQRDGKHHQPHRRAKGDGSHTAHDDQSQERPKDVQGGSGWVPSTSQRPLERIRQLVRHVRHVGFPLRRNNAAHYTGAASADKTRWVCGALGVCSLGWLPLKQL